MLTTEVFSVLAKWVELDDEGCPVFDVGCDEVWEQDWRRESKSEIQQILELMDDESRAEFLACVHTPPFVVVEIELED